MLNEIEEPTYSPERALWLAVIEQALTDLVRAVDIADARGRRTARLQAANWFRLTNPDLIMTCDLAGVDVDAVMDRAKAKGQSRSSKLTQHGKIHVKSWRTTKQVCRRYYLDPSQGKRIQILPTNKAHITRLQELDGKTVRITGEADVSEYQNVVRAIFPSEIVEVKHG